MQSTDQISLDDTYWDKIIKEGSIMYSFYTLWGVWIKNVGSILT